MSSGKALPSVLMKLDRNKVLALVFVCLVVMCKLVFLLGAMQITHVDIQLDDIWCLDLNKLDGWRCVKENTTAEQDFKDDSEWETDEDE